MSGVVLATAQEYNKAETEFRSAQGFTVEPAPAEEQLLAAAVLEHNCRGVIVGVESYTGRLYEALGKTGRRSGAIIARFGVGHDGIDKELARKNNIVVTNTPGVLDRSVAEHAIWLIGALARNIAVAHCRFRQGRFAPLVGNELYGKALGIIGFGAIGKQVAKIAHLGFGMRVLAADCMTPEELESRPGMSLERLKAEFGLDEYTQKPEEILARADVVSVHLPSTPSTRHFINAEKLAHMRPSAVLINTSRGWVLDEDALFDALSQKRIAGAALDVFENEPYKPVSPHGDLRTLDNIVLTPHIGSNTLQANQRMARACLENVSNFLAGRAEKLSRVLK
jgi:lactate dehydrogenase-like 2-hydroxyacid dehydrogenase